jgi:hypothetical protein
MEMVGFAIVLAVVLAEWILSGLFNKFYFTFGIPLFRRELPCTSGETDPPSPEELEDALPSTAYYPLAFHEFDESRYGFRERFWGGGFFKFHYTPLMHGLLTFDHDAKRVRVTGFANWFSIAFVFFFVVYLPKEDVKDFGVFFTAVLALLYGIQAYRFGKVAQAAADAWSASGGYRPALDTTAAGLDTSIGDAPVGEPLASLPERAALSIGRVWRVLTVSAFGVVLITMLLTLMGDFTAEWTCRETNGDWVCVGPHCDSEASKHFDTYRRTVSCERTDWPMAMIGRVARFILPAKE